MTAVAAVDEEGCSGAVVSEHVEDSGCVDVGTVVEGEGYCAWDRAVVEDGAVWEGGIVWDLWDRYEWR